MAARKAAAKKASAKAPEPQIQWKSQPPYGAMFLGSVGDITYRVTPDYTQNGEFTWVTEVRLSGDEVRTLEEAQQAAEDDLS